MPNGIKISFLPDMSIWNSVKRVKKFCKKKKKNCIFLLFVICFLYYILIVLIYLIYFFDIWGNPMNFKHLQTFYTLSKEKNFTKTAALLGCAQSNVTTQIRLLESELGVLLFERIGRHISLTPEGERLLPYAKKMLSLSEEISSLYHHPGRLTIGVTESIAVYLSGDILKEFLEKPRSPLRILRPMAFYFLFQTAPTAFYWNKNSFPKESASNQHWKRILFLSSKKAPFAASDWVCCPNLPCKRSWFIICLKKSIILWIFPFIPRY